MRLCRIALQRALLLLLIPKRSIVPSTSGNLLRLPNVGQATTLISEAIANQTYSKDRRL